MKRLLETGSLAIGLFCMLTLVGDVSGATDPVKAGGSYHYIFDNITKVEDDASVTVWMSLPGDRPGQKVKFSSFYPRPVEIVRDHEYGNRLAIWRLDPDEISGELIVGYDFTVELQQVEGPRDIRHAEGYDTTSDLYKLYTRPETWIETTGPVFAKAREIVGDRISHYEQARLIFDWLVDNLQFVPGGTWQPGAEGTLAGLKGDCGQYSRLFVAMCRSLGIPARTITSQHINGGLHRYAEFYLPNREWLPVDIAVAQILIPGKSVLSESEAREFATVKGLQGKDPAWLFGNTYSGQMVVTVGNNIRVSLGEPAGTREFIVLEPGGLHAVPQAALIRGLNEDVVHGGFFHFGPMLDDAAIRDLAHQRLASLYLNAGMVDLVAESCLIARHDDYDPVISWLNLGRVHLRKGNYVRAEASIQRAMTVLARSQFEKLEGTIWSHIYLGQCYDLMGRRELALQEYQTVLEMKNNYRGALDIAHRYMVKPFTKDDF